MKPINEYLNTNEVELDEAKGEGPAIEFYLQDCGTFNDSGLQSIAQAMVNAVDTGYAKSVNVYAIDMDGKTRKLSGNRIADSKFSGGRMTTWEDYGKAIEKITDTNAMKVFIMPNGPF
jgi:pyruvate/2-oxoacid:ferredoxin oxidoreductase beta subunit